MSKHRRYMCRRCNALPERFRAKDNVPEYAHLCVGCASLLSAEALTHYVDLDNGQPPRPEAA